MIRVVIADDHKVVRVGLEQLLETFDDVEFLGSGAGGEQAVALCEHHRPDVLLLDLSMPDLDGIEVTKRLRDASPDTKVVVFTSFSDRERIVQALDAGAVGYLLKDAATGELELALRTVIRGESWLSPAVSRQVVDGYVQRVGGDAGLDVLTARQREVLRLVASGKSTKEIAFVLNLSVKTVETHRAQIMDRLGIRDVAGLVRYALRTGLIPPEG